MNTSDQPFQFSLRTLFALTLLAAALFAAFRWGGVEVFLYLTVVVAHVAVMTRLSRAPHPWSTARQDLVTYGWLILSPYAPLGVLLAVAAASAPAHANRFLVSTLMGLMYLTIPLNGFCYFRADKLALQVLSGEPVFQNTFRVSSQYAFVGILLALGGTCLNAVSF